MPNPYWEGNLCGMHIVMLNEYDNAVRELSGFFGLMSADEPVDRMLTVSEWCSRAGKKFMSYAEDIRNRQIRAMIDAE